MILESTFQLGSLNSFHSVTNIIASALLAASYISADYSTLSPKTFFASSIAAGS